MNDLETTEQTQSERDFPEVDATEAFETVISSPNTASKRWVYRQYDHEVQVRTAVRPGDDAAVLAIRDAGTGLAFSAGADPNWTDAAPYEGGRAVALENAANVAAKGATPLAAVDCLNGGNPEKPGVYGGFASIVDGLADMCAALETPVVGGNVSLYNDSASGPIPPTPTLALVGTKDGYDAPPLSLSGDGELVLVGDRAVGGDSDPRLGGSEYLAQFGGSDRFPALPDDPKGLVETVAAVADDEATLATHDVSHGGLAVALAEMITADSGATVDIDCGGTDLASLFHEQPGRVLVETTDPDSVRDAFDGVAPVTHLGSATDTGTLSLSAGETTLHVDVDSIRAYRRTIEHELS